jgi:hypothetical protein
MLKTRKYYHKAEQRKAKGISARIEVICKRAKPIEILWRDPMEQLARTGRIRGRKVG